MIKSELSGLAGILEDEFREKHSSFRYKKIPLTEPLNLHNIFEHTPLDYYKYGEYPRFIRPIGAHQPRYEIIKERINK
jgi:hypothetical protein